MSSAAVVIGALRVKTAKGEGWALVCPRNSEPLNPTANISAPDKKG